MNRARQVTLLVVAGLVVAFVATWTTMPSRTHQEVSRPASLFARGLDTPRRDLCERTPQAVGCVSTSSPLPEHSVKRPFVAECLSLQSDDHPPLRLKVAHSAVDHTRINSRETPWNIPVVKDPALRKGPP